MIDTSEKSIEHGAEPFEFKYYSKLAPCLSRNGCELFMGGVIYGIENMINHKIYIGQTVHRVKKRFDEHKRAKSVIGNAIREFGIENFVFVVIEECETIEQLNAREKYWIEKLNCRCPNGYNVQSGGRNFVTKRINIFEICKNWQATDKN